MRTYIFLLLLSLGSFSVLANFRGIASRSTSYLSSTDAKLLVSDPTDRPQKRSSEGRGSGRRQFFQRHIQEATLA